MMVPDVSSFQHILVTTRSYDLCQNVVKSRGRSQASSTDTMLCCQTVFSGKKVYCDRLNNSGWISIIYRTLLKRIVIVFLYSETNIYL